MKENRALSAAVEPVATNVRAHRFAGRLPFSFFLRSFFTLNLRPLSLRSSLSLGFFFASLTGRISFGLFSKKSLWLCFACSAVLMNRYDPESDQENNDLSYSRPPLCVATAPQSAEPVFSGDSTDSLGRVNQREERAPFARRVGFTVHKPRSLVPRQVRQNLGPPSRQDAT